MKAFRSFFKTSVGRKPQCEGGEAKTAETAGAAAVAASMKSAFNTPPPTPAPAPADVSPSQSLGSRITTGLKSMLGG